MRQWLPIDSSLAALAAAPGQMILLENYARRIDRDIQKKLKQLRGR